MAGGRPTDYRPEYCEALVEHMASGLSYETFSATIGTCRASLYVWEKAHPEFLDAKKRGFEVCQIFWEKLGIKHIVNKSSKEEGSESLNTGVYVFQMKNRFKWTDRVEVVKKDQAPTGYEEAEDSDLDEL